MGVVDRSEIAQLVRDLRVEAVGYNRQWLNWLGVASGGGAVALLSFSANLPDPDYALRALLPALAAFAAGICFAGLAVLTASLRVGASERHHGAAFTRDELGDAIRSVPVMVSAPRRLADEHNAPRAAMIGQHDERHGEAELAWTRHVRWRWLNRLCLAVSAACFVAGLCAPLLRMATGGSFAPPGGRTGAAVVGSPAPVPALR